MKKTIIEVLKTYGVQRERIDDLADELMYLILVGWGFSLLSFIYGVVFGLIISTLLL